MKGIACEYFSFLFVRFIPTFRSSSTYTGCGGRDTKDGEKVRSLISSSISESVSWQFIQPREGPQTCDQTWDNTRNAALRLSAHNKKPVRVVRGYNSKSDFAPVQGYRYDGLYVVDQVRVLPGLQRTVLVTHFPL